ncbi:MAG: ABC transporter ATP-binding protein [Clostridia bacterium]|nr:ABC transporter ATP-binding protein [Clostridia bacterium]
MMRAENLSRRFFRKSGSANFFYAVNPLNLELHPGEVTVLTGRSGSGKTTLLNMLAGLLPPTDGKVWLGETDLYSLNDRDLSRLRNEKIGVVPQGRSAIDTLTVFENIALPAEMTGRKWQPELALEQMEHFGIGHLREARPAELSGGELRRMAIVRAMVHRPDILCAVEPTGDLDDENTEKVFSTFRAYAHEQGKSVFIVTHESDALRYADTVYRMNQGTITREK